MSKLLQQQYDEVLRENVDLIERNKKLLSKLEAAEKALEECKAYDEHANCHWCGGKIKEITNEALQQLRS